MSIVVFDTETSGMYNFKRPYDDPSQPYLIELAALYKNETGNVEAELETLVKLPENITVDDGAFKAHGISKEKAEAEGVPLEEAFTKFSLMVANADIVIAHNLNFDAKILARCALLLGVQNPLDGKVGYCTMLKATDICRLPGRYNNYKWPTLNEAYRILVNPDGFEGAHRAMNDVRACYEVYKALQQQPQ